MSEAETRFENGEQKTVPVKSEYVLSSREWQGLKYLLERDGFVSCRAVGYQGYKTRIGLGWLYQRRVVLRDDDPRSGCFYYFRDSPETWRIVADSLNYYQPTLNVLETEGLRFLKEMGYIVEREEWLGHPASFENYMLRMRGYVSWREDLGIEYVLLTEQGITGANSLPPRERKPLCDSLDPDDLNLDEEEVRTLIYLYDRKKKPTSLNVLQDQVDFEILVELYERGLVGYDYDHNHISLTEVGEAIAEAIDWQNLNTFEKLALVFMKKRRELSTRQAQRQDDRICLGIALLKGKGIVEYLHKGSGFYRLNLDYTYKGELPPVDSSWRIHTIHWEDMFGKVHDIDFKTSKPTGIPASSKDDRQEYMRLYYLNVIKRKREAQLKNQG